MKALRLQGKGGPENLFYEDAPQPILEKREVLVRVHACAITKAELSWVEVHQAPDVDSLQEEGRFMHWLISIVLAGRLNL